MREIIEDWKPVIGYEGIYEVSSLGRVRKVATGLILHQSNRGGYRQVGLRKDGTWKTESVHRLVAKAFLPNPDMLPQINHRDEDKANNCVENLEWCDCSYNMRYNDLQLRNREKATTRYTIDVKRMENGHILRNLRKAKEWTLDEAAARAGISGNTLTRIESGFTSVSFDTLESLANIYGYTLTITKKEDNNP
jgi:DNA-binding XRE family transcriptional regulator